MLPSSSAAAPSPGAGALCPKPSGARNDRAQTVGQSEKVGVPDHVESSVEFRVCAQNLIFDLFLVDFGLN